MPFHFRSAHDFPLQKVTHLLEPQQDYHYTNGASNGVIGAQHLVRSGAPCSSELHEVQ